jgi:putative transposase
VDDLRKGRLPRLTSNHYWGHAFVHWTLTIANRETGWLTPSFFGSWQLALLHASARYRVVCPIYVVMPDHIHLLWLGLARDGSEQKAAMEFLRKQLRPAIAPFSWKHQAHDHVLREHERETGAFIRIANYVRENPSRAGLVRDARDYRYLGCCVPGYPSLDIWSDDYWERFWRIYGRLIDSS